MLGIALFLGACAGMPQAISANPPALAAAQQSAACRGTVLDDAGEPVIGATVSVPGTKAAVNTDIDGNFNLGNIALGSTIRVSYIGYSDKDVKWQGQPLTIRLESTSNMLNEMVVVGYGVVRKADLAGSVSVLDSKSFSAQPITQASEALQGRVAGVNVISDGVPGGSVKIRVRGTNSINNSNEPLYVVDGMVRETGLEGINPEDIASMQVLKDASSTAIYGSRGANGVVLITTKTAKKGATQIVLDASVGWSQSVNLPEKVDAQQYTKGMVDWFGFDPNDPRIAPYYTGQKDGIDWMDEIYRTGVTQNYRLVLAKGGENAQVYFSGNYMRNEATLEGAQYERFSAKINGKASITDWLDLTADIQASRGVAQGVGGIDMGGFSPLYCAATYSPAMEMFNENGAYARDPFDNNLQNNPLAMLVAQDTKRYKDVFAGHLDLRFNLSKQLSFTTSNGIDYYNYSGYSFTPVTSDPNSSSNPSASNSYTNRMLLQSVNNFTYINTWNEKHNLTATAVWEATKSTTHNLTASANNLLTGSVGYWNLPLGKTINVTNGMSDWALLSAVGRAIYNYDDRYMLTATFRADGTSRFQNNKWGYFPSVAAAWTLSNESFFENIKPTISNLKVRASFGIVGNQDITPHSTIPVMTQTTANLGSVLGSNTTYIGFWNNAIGTPDLKWEKTNQYDFGVDIAFLNGRIDASLDLFFKETSDALMLITAAQYIGGSSYYINAGKVQNKGFDFSVNAAVLQGPEFNWNTTVNLSYNKNKVVKMTADTPKLLPGSVASIMYDPWVVMEGEPIGSFYGYKWAGVNSNGQDTYYAADGSVVTNPTEDDRTVLGKAMPDLTLGWNNTFSYKGFSLNAFFTAAFGQQRLNVLRAAMAGLTNTKYPVSKDFFDNYGPGKTFATPGISDNFTVATCSKYVENANYFRLDNLSLAYDFGRNLTKFADIRLSLGVQNLFTISSYKGSNPAGFPTASQGDRANGVDTGTYPCVRTWTVGARFNF